MSNVGFEEDFNNQMTFASYTAWQINETVKGLFIGKGSGTGFQTYLKSMGMLQGSNNEPKKDQTNLEVEKEKALATANAIVQLHKKGRDKKA